MKGGKVSSGNKVEVINYFKQETDKEEEFNDKMRLLMIYIMCGSDLSEIR